MTTIIFVLTVAYLLGSIPTSILAGKLTAGIDIREHGSGNAGATNVYRVLGLGPAIVTGLIDVAKGAVAVLVISPIEFGAPSPLSTVMMQLLAGGAAVAGHIWTIFAGFKGGKGMATAVGALAFIVPTALGVVMGVWLVLLFTLRIMSVASLGAAVILPIATWIWETNPDGSTSSELLWFTVILGALIFFTHRSNITRLIRGEEKRLGRMNGADNNTSNSQPSTPAGNGSVSSGSTSGNEQSSTGNGPRKIGTRPENEVNEEMSREIGKRISSGDTDSIAGNQSTHLAQNSSNHEDGA